MSTGATVVQSTVRMSPRFATPPYRWARTVHACRSVSAYQTSRPPRTASTARSRPAFTSPGTRTGTGPAISPRRIFLVQVQRHGLLGHRGPQPFDLRPSLRQRSILCRDSRPARHRGGQRVQRALLGRPADVHHGRAVHTRPVGGLPLGRLPRSTPARRSRTSRPATTAGEPSRTVPSRSHSTTSTASRSVRHADPWLGISKIEWFSNSDARHTREGCR